MVVKARKKRKRLLGTAPFVSHGGKKDSLNSLYLCSGRKVTLILALENCIWYAQLWIVLSFKNKSSSLPSPFCPP